MPVYMDNLLFQSLSVRSSTWVSWGQFSLTLSIVSLETWHHVLDVNLTGIFLCYRAAARQMLKQGRGGRIIGEH